MIAITRQVSPGIGNCELTHMPRRDIDLARAQAQHLEYERALEAMGCRVHSLPAQPDLPDSVFVEDTAIVLKELAVITRPGAASRRPETASVAVALRAYRPVFTMQAPGTLDGGDVLTLGTTLYVGRSARSNQAGIKQLLELVSPYGYHVETVEVSGCLHLKSAVTQVGEGQLLVNSAWMDARSFGDMEIIDIDPMEPYAANGLLVGGELLYPTGFPKTLQRLARRGVSIRTVDVSELQKAEGAVTCCSLIFYA